MINFGFNKTQWALPFFIAWVLDMKMKVIVFHFLCFSICYEWYADEQ